MHDLFGALHQLLRLGDTTLDMLESKRIDEAVADTLVHDKFHVQVGFPAQYAVPIQLVDGFLAADGSEDGDGAKLVDVVVDRLHADGAHVCDKEACVKGA